MERGFKSIHEREKLYNRSMEKPMQIGPDRSQCLWKGTGKPRNEQVSLRGCEQGEGDVALLLQGSHTALSCGGGRLCEWRENDWCVWVQIGGVLSRESSVASAAGASAGVLGEEGVHISLSA